MESELHDALSLIIWSCGDTSVKKKKKINRVNTMTTIETISWSKKYTSRLFGELLIVTLKTNGLQVCLQVWFSEIVHTARK